MTNHLTGMSIRVAGILFALIALASVIAPTSAEAQQQGRIQVPTTPGQVSANGSCEVWDGINGGTGSISRCRIMSGTQLTGYRLTQTTMGGDGMPIIREELVDPQGRLTGNAVTTTGLTQSTQDATTGEVETSVPVANEIGGAIAGAYRCVSDGLFDCTVHAVGIALVGIATFFLGIAGVLLNLAVVETVFGFSTLIGNSPALLQAWGILRDLANMALLFGFIFIGISTILGADKYSVKKALPRLLIFAILMNFSLFVAQAVIDVSNVLSSTMYSQVTTSNTCSNAANQVQGTGTYSNEAYVQGYSGAVNDCLKNVGIAGAFMNASGLSSIFDFNLRDGQAVKNISLHVSLALFATVGALVFFAAAIMLIIRAIVLIFLMITAPIGFAALALPQMTDVGKKWWSALVHQSFFAPIMILLMLISIKFAESLGGIKGQGMAAALAQPNTSVMMIFLLFALVMGLMLGSLVAAQKFGAMGSAMAINWGTKFAVGGTTRGINLATNLGARGIRSGIQRGAAGIGNVDVRARVGNAQRRLASSAFAQTRFGQTIGTAGATVGQYASRAGRIDLGGKTLAERAASVGAGTGAFAARQGKKAVMNTFGKLENANLDMRRISYVQTALEKAGAGKAATPSDKEATVEGMKKQWEDFQERGNEKVKAYDDLNKKRKDEAVMEGIMRKAEANDPLSPEERTVLAKMNVKKLEDLDGIKNGVQQLVENLSPEQFEGLMKSEKLKPAEIAKIRTARYAGLTTEANNGDTAAVKRRLKNMSKSDLEAIPPDLIQNPVFLGALSDKQRDDLAGSKKRTDPERETIRNSSPAAIFEAEFENQDPDLVQRAARRTAAATSIAGTLSIPQVGKLDKGILTDREVAEQLTPAMLIELQESKKLKAAEASAIARHIMAGGSAASRAFISPGGDGAAYWIP